MPSTVILFIEAIAQLVERTAHNSNYKCSSHFSLMAVYSAADDFVVRFNF